MILFLAEGNTECCAGLVPFYSPPGKKFYFSFCILAFSAPLGYPPRHVPIRNFICQHRLGVPVAPFLERPG